jgi:hypothetical protein
MVRGQLSASGPGAANHQTIAHIISETFVSCSKLIAGLPECFPQRDLHGRVNFDAPVPQNRQQQRELPVHRDKNPGNKKPA